MFQSLAALRPLTSFVGGAGHSLDVATPTLLPRVVAKTTARSAARPVVASRAIAARSVVASWTIAARSDVAPRTIAATTVARGATARVIVPLSGTSPTAGLLCEPAIIAATALTARFFAFRERSVARGSRACFSNRAIRYGRRRCRGRRNCRLSCPATFAVEHEQRGCRHLYGVHFGQDGLDDGNPWQVRS